MQTNIPIYLYKAGSVEKQYYSSCSRYKTKTALTFLNFKLSLLSPGHTAEQIEILISLSMSTLTFAVAFSLFFFFKN